MAVPSDSATFIKVRSKGPPRSSAVSGYRSGMTPSSAERSIEEYPPMGKPAASAASKAPRSTPVWPPEMIRIKIVLHQSIILSNCWQGGIKSGNGQALFLGGVRDNVSDRLFSGGKYRLRCPRSAAGKSRDRDRSDGSTCLSVRGAGTGSERTDLLRPGRA